MLFKYDLENKYFSGKLRFSKITLTYANVVYSKNFYKYLNFLYLQGVSEILSSYWLMVPSNIIKQILVKFFKELAVDASSAEVRCQVIKVSCFVRKFIVYEC